MPMGSTNIGLALPRQGHCRKKMCPMASTEDHRRALIVDDEIIFAINLETHA